MAPKRPLRTGLPIALFGAFVAGCGGPAPSPPAPVAPAVVETVAPATARGDLPEPHLRYPVGSRLVRRDPSRPAASPVTLTATLAAAGGPVPSADGRSVLFVGKESPEDPYAVWRSDADGASLRKVVSHPGDCGAAAELPDGRIVYAGAVDGPPVVRGMRSAWALFVAGPDGGPGERITFGAGCDVDPSVLADGRIVYSSWQPTDEGIHLWTVHPDGTGATRLPGDHGGVPFALLPRLGDDGALHYVLHVPWGASRVPSYGRSSLGAPDDGASNADPGYPLGAVIRPRPRAQGHLSMVRPGVTHGTLLGVDARAPDGRGRRVRLLAVGERPAGGGPPPTAPLGEAPLAADGSFFARVPADRPLVLEVLDADGRVVGGQATPFWVRPNEVRACVGCHEDGETAPPNRRPLAVTQAPVSLLGEAPR